MGAVASRLLVKGLCKTIKGKPVLDQVSLDIEGGRIIGILGPNGAGKSTCFQIIIGVMAPDSGTISIEGTDITHCQIDERARMGVGYLPQDTSVFTRLSVEDNVKAILEIRGMRGNSLNKQALGLLEEIGIAHLRANDPTTLSGGERRKLEIARALAITPKFILLDEPFAAIDPISISDLQQTLNLLKEREIGVVITDHNVREALRICDHAYILSNGRVLASGTPHEITKNDDVRQAYLGSTFDR